MNDNTNTTQPIPHTQPMRFVDIPDHYVDTGPTHITVRTYTPVYNPYYDAATKTTKYVLTVPPL
jgi:hypothetical protein